MLRMIIRFFLFRLDPELSHTLSVHCIRLVHKIPLVPSLWRRLYWVDDPQLKRTVFGIDFPHPIGLAAGFDKDAEIYHEMADLGFSFIEIGTLTPRAQLGNTKKRLFRLVKDEAIINRMGFNNKGIDAAKIELLKNKGVIIGGNIGKNRDTPNNEALEDYEYGFRELFPVVDYFAINVSSPNTPNLRALQDKEPLTHLLLSLQALNDSYPKPKPILLKIAPDLTDAQLTDIIEIIKESKIAGVIATNTTISRENIHSEYRNEAGGLSGKPLTNRSTEVIRFISENSQQSIPIIGVGGIHSVEDALEKLAAGASLIQLYTGFIYEGPALVKAINHKILQEKQSKE